MAIARIATCVALATSGTTSALKRIDGTRTTDAVPTKCGLGPVITRPPGKRCAGVGGEGGGLQCVGREVEGVGGGSAE